MQTVPRRTTLSELAHVNLVGNLTDAPIYGFYLVFSFLMGEGRHSQRRFYEYWLFVMKRVLRTGEHSTRWRSPPRFNPD